MDQEENPKQALGASLSAEKNLDRIVEESRESFADAERDIERLFNTLSNEQMMIISQHSAILQLQISILDEMIRLQEMVKQRTTTSPSVLGPTEDRTEKDQKSDSLFFAGSFSSTGVQIGSLSRDIFTIDEEENSESGYSSCDSQRLSDESGGSQNSKRILRKLKSNLPTFLGPPRAA